MFNFNYSHLPTWNLPSNVNQLFTPEFHIDSLQSLKRNITNQVITDKTLNQAANNFIDAQTTFAKMLTKNALDISRYGFDSVSEKVFPKKESKESKEAKETKVAKE
jgi:hypothetical protein